MGVLTIEENNSVAVVGVQFEKLDMSTASEFKKRMAPVITSYQRIVLDMDAVTFVDSSGLGGILSCLRELSTSGGDLKLCRVQKRVRVMFELVRMHRILSIFPTCDEAVAAFTP